MNEEAAVVSLFLTLRVFLVGGILLSFPRIARKGLVFGTYVGEEAAGGDAVRGLVRSWDRSCVTLMASALLVGWGISLAGWPLPGNLTGTALLLLGAPVLYVRMFRRARGLAPPDAVRRAQRVTASLAVSESRRDGFAKLALGICLLAGLATFAYALAGFEAMSEPVPTLFSISGLADGPADKSLVAGLFAPLLNLVFSSSFAMIGLLMTTAKRSVRGGSGGRSAQAQDAFRRATAHMLSAEGLFLCLFLTSLSVQTTRMALSQTESVGGIPLVIAVAMILYMLACLFWLLRRVGQGGALLEEGSVEAPLTGGLADNSHWIGGVFYIDKDDPSLLVESRFGIGYTLNLGNRSARLLAGTYCVLILGLVVLLLTGAVS